MNIKIEIHKLRTYFRVESELKPITENKDVIDAKLVTTNDEQNDSIYLVMIVNV